MGLEDFYQHVRKKPPNRADLLSAHEPVIGPEELQPTTFLGKALQGAENVLGAAANQATRRVFLPIAEKMTENDPLMQYRLGKLRSKRRPIYLSDVTSEMGFLRPGPVDEAPLGMLPGGMRIARGAGRFAQDILGDPLTYVSFGTATPLGKAVQLINAAKRAKQSVGLASKVGKQAARAIGAKQLTPELIRTFPKSLEGRPLAEQIKAGHRAFAQIDFPGLPKVPLVPRAIGAQLARPFSALSRIRIAARLENSFRELFSTKAGVPEFDKMATEFKELALDRASGKVEEGKALNKRLNRLATDLGIKRGQLDETITRVVNKETMGIAGRAVRKVTGPAAAALGKLKKKGKGEAGFAEGIDPEDVFSGKVPDDMRGMQFPGTKPGAMIPREQLDKMINHPSNWGLVAKNELGIDDLELRKMVDRGVLKPVSEANMLNKVQVNPDGSVWEFVDPTGPSYNIMKLVGLLKGKKAPDILRYLEGKKVIKGWEQVRAAREAAGLPPHIEKWDIPPPTAGITGNIGDMLSGLNPNSPVEVMESVMNWIDDRLAGDVLGLAKKGEKRDPTLRSSLIKLKAWLERALGDPGAPEGPPPRAPLDPTRTGINQLRAAVEEIRARLPKGEIEKPPYPEITPGAPQKPGIKLTHKGPEVPGEEGIPAFDPLTEPTTKVPRTKPSKFSGKYYESPVNLKKALKKEPEGSEVPYVIYPDGKVVFGKPGTDHVEAFGFGSKEASARIASGEIKSMGRLYMTQLGEVSSESFLIGKGEDDLVKALKEQGITPQEGETALDIYSAIEPGVSEGNLPIPLEGDLGGVRAPFWKDLFEREVVETPEQLQKLIEGDDYVPPQAKAGVGSFEVTPEGAIKEAPVDPRVQTLINELRESSQRQALEEEVSGVYTIPPSADKEFLRATSVAEAREAWANAQRAMGKAPKFKDFDERLIRQLREEFIEVKPEVIDQWVSGELITKEQAKVLKGKRGLEYLDQLLEKDIISEKDFSEAVNAMGPDEINQMNKAGELSHIFGDYQGDVFHTDPVFSSTMRGVRGDMARTTAEFHQELIKRGIAVPADSPKAQGLVGTRVPGLQGYKFDPEVARVLDNQHRFNTRPEEVHEFIQMFDKVQDWWKSWTLAIFPAYHSRNFVGNMWNNFLAGVYNPDVYRMAGEVRLRRPVSFTDGLGKKWDTESLNQAARRYGVVDRGWVGADVERTLRQRLGEGKWNPLAADNKIVNAGFKFGKMIENNARMGHFISKLQEGYTAAEAALSVKQYLFDYSDLTNFERKYMKRLFPFYTWTRKNVPLQLKHLIQTPAKMGLPFKARVESEREGPHPNLKHMAPWMVENFPNRVRYNPKTGDYDYFLLNSWLPAMDLVKVMELHETAVNMSTPVLKEVIQQAFNYDFFLKKKIEDYPGQKERFLRMDLPKRVTHAAKVIRLLNEADKLTKEDQDVVSALSSFVTGKTYTFNPREARTFHYIRVNKEIQELMTSMRREKRKPKPNLAEVERIRKLIREKKKEF